MSSPQGGGSAGAGVARHSSGRTRRRATSVASLSSVSSVGSVAGSTTTSAAPVMHPAKLEPPLGTPGRQTTPRGACWARLTYDASVPLCDVQLVMSSLGAFRTHVDADSAAPRCGAICVAGRPVAPAAFGTALVLFPSRGALRQASDVLAQHGARDDRRVAPLWGKRAASAVHPTLSLIGLAEDRVIASNIDRSLSERSVPSVNTSWADASTLAGRSSSCASPNHLHSSIQCRVSGISPERGGGALDAVFALITDYLRRDASMSSLDACVARLLDAARRCPAAVVTPAAVVVPFLVARVLEDAQNAMLSHLPSPSIPASLIGRLFLGDGEEASWGRAGLDPFAVPLALLQHLGRAKLHPPALFRDIELLVRQLGETVWGSCSPLALQLALLTADVSRRLDLTADSRLGALRLSRLLSDRVAIVATTLRAWLQSGTLLRSPPGGRAERRRRTVFLKHRGSNREALLHTILLHGGSVDRVRQCSQGRMLFVEFASERSARIFIAATASSSSSSCDAVCAVEAARSSIGDELDYSTDALFAVSDDGCRCVRPCLYGITVQ